MTDNSNIREIEQWYVPEGIEDLLKKPKPSSDTENEEENNN